MSARSVLSHLIQYRCVKPDHMRMDVLDRVFVHGDGWAYCLAGRNAADHAFLPTGGLKRQSLERGMSIKQRS